MHVSYIVLLFVFPHFTWHFKFQSSVGYSILLHTAKTKTTMDWKNATLLALPLLLPLHFAQFASTHLQATILFLTVVAVLGFLGTYYLIPVIAKYNTKAGIYGFDINKKGLSSGKVKIAESLGIACGIIYFGVGQLIPFLFQYLNLENENRLIEYNAAISSIVFMMFLGFADDVVEFPWRYKLILPGIASLPIVTVYSRLGDATSVLIPSYLSQLMGISRIVDLGIIYLVFIFLLIIFCTNAINIHAGINGLEAGQSYIIAIFILTHNIIEASYDEQGRSQHIFSMLLTAPFIGITMGLLNFNWYPSKVFVGDSYTMLSGMTLAVSGVLGHCSKTLLLFFIPQVLNFLYSVPQLFKLFGYTCPKHRLPRYDNKKDLLHSIPSNLNLVNLFLRIFGPMSEKNLCVCLLVFQFALGLLGLGVRYFFSKLLY